MHIIGLVLLLVPSFVLWGCEKENTPTSPSSKSFDTGEEVLKKVIGPVFSLGAFTGIAWPFGPSENPSNWRGQGEQYPYRTEGGMISACGGWISSHSGADYYARDLSRITGVTAGKSVFAGIDGRVVKANWTDCYGNCVVIYDASRRIAVRYAHLQSIGVTNGQWVTMRQYIGQVGNTGCGTFNPHLHLVVYENIDHFVGGDPNRPVIPIVCDSDYYACIVYFFS